MVFAYITVDNMERGVSASRLQAEAHAKDSEPSGKVEI